MIVFRHIVALRALVYGMAGIAATGSATDLTIGISADATAIDPHFDNVTPNNNVAAQIFDCLVLRDERQKDSRPCRELESNRPADMGIQAAQGRQVS